MEPPSIKKLNEDVINRIAAGEIIQRPANALKELIENSLDAKATNILITVKHGGLRYLQIEDNGTGIRKEDFNIVCERFTTSKLIEFEDLHKISTYGFRGEALASISHIAHLTITSKTKYDICAYQANFVDSKLVGIPKPTAGNQGTIITVEDLFYNMNVRKKALRSAVEEFKKIAEVVSKYSIHNANVGFSLKKFDENRTVVRTPMNSNKIENIQIIYGSTVSRELIEFNLENNQFKFNLKGYISNVNYSSKIFHFLLFINNRLVDCQSLKKCIDQVYSVYLPKNNHPFVYLSLELDPNNIDINVHPTKHEVHFLNEDQIVECISSAMEAKLLRCNSSRTFFTQTKLPKVLDVELPELKDKVSSPKIVYQSSMIRTDAREQKLEKFFGEPSKKIEQKLNESITEDQRKKFEESFLNRADNLENEINLNRSALDDTNISYKTEQVEKITVNKENVDTTKIPVIKAAFNKENVYTEKINASFIKKINRCETKLTSVLQLRKEIEENCHRALRETFAQHVFVGSINPTQALIQYSTKLYLCNTKKILVEMFYQFFMYNFQNFDSYEFENKIPIFELAMICLDLPESGWTPEDGDKSELAKRISDILLDKSAMLQDYFSFEIDNMGNLCSIPVLLENYLPDPTALPMYIVRLATEVNWESEKECFQTFGQETAKFFAKVSMENNQNEKDWQWVTEYILYPAIKEYFIPPKCFVENSAILEIADLHNLYKVFERC